MCQKSSCVTVIRINPGMVTLMTDDFRTFEMFPELLPKNIMVGKILNLAIKRDVTKEKERIKAPLEIADRLIALDL